MLYYLAKKTRTAGSGGHDSPLPQALRPAVVRFKYPVPSTRAPLGCFLPVFTCVYHPKDGVYLLLPLKNRVENTGRHKYEYREVCCCVYLAQGACTAEESKWMGDSWCELGALPRPSENCRQNALFLARKPRPWLSLENKSNVCGYTNSVSINNRPGSAWSIIDCFCTRINFELPITYSWSIPVK